MNNTISEMKFIKSLNGRPYHLKTYATYVQIKVVNGDKFYLGRANTDTLRRIHRKASQAEAYGRAVAVRLGQLRVTMVMEAIQAQAQKLSELSSISADEIALVPQEEMALA